MTDVLTLNEAVGALSDGHTMYSEEYARKVLRALGFVVGDLPEWLVTRWQGQYDANPNNDPKGLTLKEDKPGSGVYSLSLGYYVCQLLGIKAPGDQFIGRGSQARANAQAIGKAVGGEVS